MQKLRQMIDAAFPTKVADRVPQKPSEAFAAREASMAATASKVETLKQARLNGAEPAPSQLFEVVRHRGSWRVLHKGKHSPAFDDQTAAIAGAVKLAKAKIKAGFPAEVVLKRTDGDVVPQPLDEDTPPAAMPEAADPALVPVAEPA